MTWFSLPETNASNTSAFHDSRSATAWLADQPQANAPAMLDALVSGLRAFNTCFSPARERFKTVEVLRKTVFTVSEECQRRYEGKPLPLLTAEQSTLDATRRLWRACTIAYLHCLRACLEGDTDLAGHGGKVAHRAITCLRMEQACCYLGGTDLDGKFWLNLHAIYASAEKLGVLRDSVSDSLPRETSESTVSGQYGMALLLSLVDPFSLTRSQFATTVRWLARWREQVAVLQKPDTSPKSCCIALDLTKNRPLHDNLRSAEVGRWLAVDNILRKMRKRVEALKAGESPESLKLGTTLSADSCIALLELLSEHLRHPRLALPVPAENAPEAEIVSGLEPIYRRRGGKRLQNPLHASTFGSRLNAEQIAVFDHVPDQEKTPPFRTENWQIARKDNSTLTLWRAIDRVESRLSLRSILAIRLPGEEHDTLALIVCLLTAGDRQCLEATIFSGEPVAVVAAARERPTGKESRHPAILLPAGEKNQQPTIMLPPGLQARSLSIRFYAGQDLAPLDFRIGDLVDRGGDHERWSVLPASV